MKKVALLFFLLMFSLFSVLLVGGIYKYYAVNTENKSVMDNIVDMGGATTLNDCYYIVFDDAKNIKTPGYYCYVRGNMIEIRSQHYSLLSVFFNRQNDVSWGSYEYTYVDILTNNCVAKINYDVMIGQHNSYGNCDPLIYFYDENNDLNVLCRYCYYKNAWGKSCDSYGDLIYNFSNKNVKIEEIESKQLNGSSLLEYVYDMRKVEYEKLFNHMILNNMSYLQANDLDEKVLIINSEEGYRGTQFVVLLDKLPNNNKRLYSEFPQLKKYKEELYGRGYVVLEFSNELNPDEMVDMLIEEEDTVSYEGVFVSEDDSIDGEMHYVTDREQYMNYYNYEKNKNYVSINYYSDSYDKL